MEKASLGLVRDTLIGQFASNAFDDDDSKASFEAFKSTVEADVKATPYVHYNSDADRVTNISDDPDAVGDEEILVRWVPNDETLREWYDELKED
jgi:hypothetical protein